MSDGTMTIAELRERVVKKATTDGAFRTQLLADPKAAIKDELGVAVPPQFTIQVHEEALPDTSHLVLPPPAALSEADLEAAAGGAVYKWNSSTGRYVGTDEAITFWDDINGPTYHGGPQHNAD